MLLLPLGHTTGPDVLFGKQFDVGPGLSSFPPGVPSGANAVFVPLMAPVGFYATTPFRPPRPPVGFYASIPTSPTPLVLDISSVSISGGFSVTLLLENTLGSVFYTLDGSVPLDYPTPGVILYLNPVHLIYPTYAHGTVITFKAKAVALPDSGFADSAVVQVVLTIP